MARPSFATETARIEHNLTLHPPQAPAIGDAMDELRSAFKAASHLVDELVPGGREKSLALTELENACAHAIGGVARNQDAWLEAASA